MRPAHSRLIHAGYRLAFFVAIVTSCTMTEPGELPHELAVVNPTMTPMAYLVVETQVSHRMDIQARFPLVSGHTRIIAASDSVRLPLESIGGYYQHAELSVFLWEVVAEEAVLRHVFRFSADQLRRNGFRVEILGD